MTQRSISTEEQKRILILRVYAVDDDYLVGSGYNRLYLLVGIPISILLIVMVFWLRFADPKLWSVPLPIFLFIHLILSMWVVNRYHLMGWYRIDTAWNPIGYLGMTPPNRIGQNLRIFKRQS